MTSWVAPRAYKPVRARVELPGSKSLTNRYLVLAALADGPSRIVAPLRARDTMLMANALRSFGVRIDGIGDNWQVVPAPLSGTNVDTGLAGTVMRFLPPLAALADGSVTFDGDEYARERPMATLIEALRQLGVEVDDDGGRGRMPFTVHGRGTVDGGVVQIDASASSQFVSGLMLAAPRFTKGIEIVHTGERAVPSQPHTDMTMAVLQEAGAAVAHPEAGVWRVEPGPIRGGERVVEPDLSNAAPFLAAALVTGGSVTIPRWPTRTTQPGDELRGLLEQMGANINLRNGDLTIHAGDELRGLDADLHDVGELTPVLAALAALAATPSRLSGIAHLRGHETDRLAALATEIKRLGGDVLEDADSLTIHPRPLHAGVWHSYADHRMATAGAVIGLAVDGVVVDDIDATSKTLPDFGGMWSALVGA